MSKISTGMLSLHYNFPFILVQISFTFLFITLLLTNYTAQSLSHEAFCGEKCGNFNIPFPFYMNQSICNSSLSDAFRVSCINSTSPFLNIGSQSYQILHFFSDGVLVDFPNTTFCRQYNDLKSFGFNGNDYFGISRDNILGLYDCEDSSLCKPDCEKNIMPRCDGSAGSYPSCCYPLSDHSAWNADKRDGFSVFSQFGCRGFSSWVVLPGNQVGKRGVKLEWAVPGNSTTASCAANADIINATSVGSGIRCECQDGYVGDGFAFGGGCLKSCIKEGKEAYGKTCYSTSHGRRKTEILAGVLTSALTITSLTAIFCVLRRPMKTDIFDHPSMTNSQGNVSFQKPCTVRMFTYHELEQATKGFQDEQILIDHAGGKATLYSGTLIDGSRIAVHRLQCDSERELVEVLSRMEALHAVSHKNVPHILGWSVDSGYTPLVVYEYPANGTLGEHLFQTKDETKQGLDWHHRINIIAETGNVLAFLQSEVCPPIVHHELNANCIFLDEDLTVKLFGLELPMNVNINNKKHSDVHNFGLVLLEVITGSSSDHLPSKTALQKITSGKLEEIVDPHLYYHEQPIFRREQIEIAADLATRCIIFGSQDGKFHIGDVSRELVHIRKYGIDGRSRRCPSTHNLEETFSNSSLLQMISMSPDSIHVPARGFS
ncbi:inactive receptor-like protein kinase [Capsicum annuum]|nr:probably inactive receptor-like protein kinase At2g46850 [Capsicum annuum]